MICDHCSCDMTAEEIADAFEDGTALCWECHDREQAEIMAEIYADMDARIDYEASLLAYHPETMDMFGDEAPF